MRVTQFTYYNNFINSQQQDLSELNQVEQQIASGKKIENIYDNPVVFEKDLSFKEEISSFDEVKNSASFAKTFANETDTTLNDMTNTLTSFKTKLLQAANDTNNQSNRQAIAKELESELTYLKNLANTSIDGKYIFSGSAFNKKPIDDNFQYQGNDVKVKAFLGAGVERAYNIDGKSLFLGRDNDYKKHTTLNVIQYNKMDANREFVVRGKNGKLYIDKNITEDGKIPDSSAPNVNEPITINSEIRSLTGVSDIYDATTDTYKDGTSYFYLKGKKPDGNNFSTKLSLSNSDTVNDLLTKIGEAFGNTSTSSVVDVSLNSDGEIQIKNSQNGKMINDFFMVASNKDENSMQDLVKNGDYIVKFQQSNFNSIRNQTQIEATNKDFDNRIFNFASTFKLQDNSRNAIGNDLIQNVIGVTAYDPNNKKYSTINDLHLTGKDTSGNDVDVTLDVTSSTTMNDLENEIKDNFGDVNVSLENGKLVVVDNTISKTESSKLSLSISAEDSNGNALEAFRSDDLVNPDNVYMKKNGNLLTSNVSQIEKDKITYYKDNQKIVENNPNAQQFATKDTTLMNVIGDDTTPKDINVTFKDVNGKQKKATMELRDTIKSITATYEAANDSILMDPTQNSNSSSKYYNTMGTSIINEKGNKVGVKYLKVTDGSTTKEISLDDNTTFSDIVNDSGGLLTGFSNGKFTTSNNNVTITLQDDNKNDLEAGFKSNYQIDLNNDGKISYGEIFNIFDDNGNLTPAHTHIKTVSTLDPVTCKLCQNEQINKGVTFKQLGDVVSMLGADDISPNSFDVYNQNLKDAENKVSMNLNNKGQINIKDNTTSSSKMDFSIYSNDFSVQENNAITIDEPQTDFFGTLQKAIQAVANGQNYANANSKDPRNFGIQGALEAIKHIMDRVGREDATTGAVSQEFDMSIQRVDMLKTHVKILQSNNIDTDIGAASIKLNSLKLSYQALLASISKVNNLTLLNYLR